MLIVQVCDFGEDGDAQYRLHDPSRQLGQLPGVTAVDCHFYHRYLPDLAEFADVLILQFVNDWELLSVCEHRRRQGKVTVFEANDYFFDLQSWSPIAARWRDRTIQELYLQLLAAADGVQTSTNELAKRWTERGARCVGVFPNHLTHVAPLLPPRDRPLTVGWAGSPGHFADWYQVAPLLQRWVEVHPEVQLAVMTNELAQPFIQLPPERYHFRRFGSLAEYLEFLRTLDIGLAPLLPTGYNRCRSDVKFLEYASQGVAGVYADLEPYRVSVVPGETGLLFQKPAEMIECLEQLYRDVPLRHKIRQQAHEYVSRERLLRDHIKERLAWYQNLLNTSGSRLDARLSSLSSEVLNVAQRDGNYLRLAPQEPERTLLEVLLRPKPAEATSVLAQLLDHHPRYLAALQSQGQLLNDRRDHRAALSYLQKARELAPYSARILSEIGRAWYRLNDDARARAALEEAIRLNPRYLPGWQYLLRMLSINKSVDGSSCAQRAEIEFPFCYPLALLGVDTHTPEQSVKVLFAILDRCASSLTVAEKPLALNQFRPAILKAVRAVPFGPEVLALLRRACEVFPESARLAGELGAGLYRAGLTDEASEFQAKALALSRQAAQYRGEFQAEETPPCTWQLSEHILRWSGNTNLER
jgi:tetratricopeptide (TPR) repeat protein